LNVHEVTKKFLWHWKGVVTLITDPKTKRGCKVIKKNESWMKFLGFGVILGFFYLTALIVIYIKAGKKFKNAINYCVQIYQYFVLDVRNIFSEDCKIWKSIFIELSSVLERIQNQPFTTALTVVYIKTGKEERFLAQ